MNLLNLNRLPALLAVWAAAASLTPALAQTTVSDAWVRATVAQQKATGAFMQITSVTGGKLVAAASPVAGTVEIHEMRMDGDVMRMAAVPGLALPAGKPVALRPGGYHIMLMDLRQPVQPGQTVALTLTVETPAGQRETVQVQATARGMGMAPGMAPGSAPMPAHGPGGHGAHMH